MLQAQHGDGGELDARIPLEEQRVEERRERGGI